MSLHEHCGHGALMSSLARARRESTLPSAILIHGAKGIGKQHLALWLGRLLLCQAPEESGPCERCHSCRLAGRVEHPDLHWYFPLPRPKNATTPEKLAQALEEARADELERFRAEPLRPTADTEARSLYLAAARSLRRRAQRKPSMGSRQIFIIAEAETLAPQASSSEAANALLKLLEEPPGGTSLILTSAEPGRLLPTIRSRTAQLHMPPLSYPEVRDFLVAQVGASEEAATLAAQRSRGAIGRALGFLRDGEEPGPLEQLRGEAQGLLYAALARDPTAGIRRSLDFPPVGARGLRDLLGYVEEGLGDLARVAAGLPAEACTVEEVESLLQAVRRWNLHPVSVHPAARRVDEARVLAAGNVNPQLVIFGLLHDLRSELTRGSHSDDPGR